MSPPPDHTFSVSEFGALLREALVVTFPSDVWVQGEVRNMSKPASGHVYFDLVDPSDHPGRPPEAVLSVMLMRTTRQIVNRTIKRAGGGIRVDDGVQLRIKAAPDFYPPQGRFQLRMNGIDPEYTLGRLAASRDQLLQTLADEDLLERNGSVPFPSAPLHVGLVTARGSAAAADFLDELRSSGLSWSVRLAATTVQGDAAAAGIAAAITACVRRRVDVVALVRGGGARTDLAAFDHELVARAIATCAVPVLTGVGHEVDRSVADIVSHRAFKTPTACAAHLVDHVRTAELAADGCWDQIVDRARARVAEHEATVARHAALAGRRATRAVVAADLRTRRAAQDARHVVRRQLDRHDDRVEAAARTLELVASHRLDTATQRLDVARSRLSGRSRHLIGTAERHVAALDERRRLLDPARNLARGWSITSTADGTVVRALDDIVPGVRLTTRVAGGTLRSTVDTVDPDENRLP